ncbi:hypothetical protein DFH06DRAFT_1122458 [Mycena polygramma]|nr:hypothetical protein DFH06DRAFT_1122458 [Mycena polygramma]
MDPFASTFHCYQQLLRAERSGESTYFRSGVNCHTCVAEGELETFKRCSGCKTVLYCSKECQLKDWKGRDHHEPHKVQCSGFKGHMAHLAAVQSVIRSFPWGRIEESGIFFHDLARARFGVLGGAGFGFWSQSGLGLFEDKEEDKFMTARRTETPDFWKKWDKKLEEQKKITFVDGQELLKDRHLTDDEGWKLPAEQVVHRDFSGGQPPRRRLSLLRDWDDWHSWREVPKSSPASLLMHYPLSIYWMLTDTLKVASSGSESRVHLTVHYIGAEVELNFIPIRVPIFSYDAPEACGSGSIRVLLHTATKHWTIPDLPTYGPKPDAILACNAGLFTYDASLDVVRGALRYKIPFAVTDYQQYMLERNDSTVSKISSFRRGTPRPVQLNPFHRPGQRGDGRTVLAPNLVNGFILAVSVGRGDHVHHCLGFDHHPPSIESMPEPNLEPNLEPMLPPELEQLIFEIPALSRPATIPRLMLVAQQVHAWVEPLLYRVVCVADTPPIEGFPRFTMDLLENALKRKPRSFFKGAVRSVFVGLTGDILNPGFFPQIQSFLGACKGITSLYMADPYLPPYRMLMYVAPMPLRRLAVKPSAIFYDRFYFKDPAFRQLTHLHLIWHLGFFAGGDPKEWKKLASLPHLTHFAFESPDTRALIYPALQACPRLECCILLCPPGADMDPAVLLPESGDVRFVVAAMSDAQVDWQHGVMGSDDMWARADAVIAERRAAIVAERLAKEAREAEAA